MSEQFASDREISYKDTLPEGFDTQYSPGDFKIEEFEATGEYRKYLFSDRSDPKNKYEVFASNKVVLDEQGSPMSLDPVFRIEDYEITEFDRTRIEQGLADLYHFIEETGMPQVVAFPDTTARPLFWAVKPLLDHLSPDRKPKIAFIKTLLPDPSSDDTGFQGRNILAKRAQEMKDLGIIAEGNEVLIVDDTTSDLRRTERAFRRIMEETVDGVDLKFFYFFGPARWEGSKRFVSGTDFRKKPFKMCPGFDYRSNPEVKYNVTGLRKNLEDLEGLYPKVLNNSEIARSTTVNFRKSLTAIGEEALATILGKDSKGEENS